MESFELQSYLGVLFEAQSRSIILTNNITINSLTCYTANYVGYMTLMTANYDLLFIILSYISHVLCPT